jgi:2-C-methyl-D-erythritol 4-phosphate cytidylyltransferase
MGRGIDKLFLSLAGKPVIFYSLSALQRSPLVGEIVMTCNASNRRKLEALVRKHRFSKVHALVKGGAERSDSVALALEAIRPAVRWVVIHDGARPLLNPEMIRHGLRTALRRGSAVIATRMVDTVKKADRALKVHSTVDRRALFAVQTPQIFQRSLIANAYRHVRKKGIAVTDDAAAVEARGGKVYLYEFEGPNLKITRRQDIPAAEALLRARRKK